MPVLPNEDSGPPPDGGGGSGGSDGGGGGGGGSAAISLSASGQRPLSRDLTSFTVDVKRLTPDVAVKADGYPLRPDEYVEVGPIRGNAQPAFYSTAGEIAARIAGPRVRFDNGDNPRSVQVSNLADIWVYSTVAGEGLTLTVKRPSQAA